jgi:hypothetical protein
MVSPSALAVLIDHELEFGRQLYRKFTGICPAEDTIDVGGRLPHRFHLIDPLGCQAATFQIETERIDRRQT